ncbi:MAG: hypothetical protein KatS3mg060_1954 [Dehalococcoidia bacterium]|nr:MAG: hypothetical protein KatS3mg060_1954 [Dehalococcoidia bacterium]
MPNGPTGPLVRAPGGGWRPRSRRKNGRWREKRSDAGQRRVRLVSRDLRPAA